MTAVLVEYEGLDDVIGWLMRNDDRDAFLDPDFQYTRFSEELIALLAELFPLHIREEAYFGIAHHISFIQSRLQQIGVDVEYAEGIAVVPGANLLVIFYDQPEPFNELRFQSWSELLVRRLPDEYSRDRLQERESVGDPGLRFRKPDYSDQTHAHQRVPVSPSGHTKQPGAVQLPKNPDRFRNHHGNRHSLDQGKHRRRGKLQKSDS